MGTITSREEGKQTHIYLDALAPTILCPAPRAREDSDPPRGTSPVTPYDTGKVKIGLAYQKPYYCETDARLQKLLLENEIVSRQELTAVAFVMAAVFIAAVMMILL
jgi:hypothetical protein